MEKKFFAVIIVFSFLSCTHEDNTNAPKQNKVDANVIYQFAEHMESFDNEELAKQPIFVAFSINSGRVEFEIFTSAYPPVIVDSSFCYFGKMKSNNHEVYFLGDNENRNKYLKFINSLGELQSVNCYFESETTVPPYTDISFSDSVWNYELITGVPKRIK